METPLSRFAAATRLALVAAVAALAACSKDPTASLPAASAMVPTVPLEHRMHFGSHHYRDHGHHPSHGASGVAAADAEALLGSNGLTTLRITSFRTGDPDHPAGEIEHVLIKILDARGRLVGVRNFGEARPDGQSTYTTQLRGLAPGFTILGWVTISGLDRKRVDVVAIPAVIVGRGPDVAITELSVPQFLVTGAPTIIAATVAELNGDHGANTDCVLLVDHAIVDRANGIWIDAGDVVSCAFTYAFGTVGSHLVQVRLDNVTPSDDNAANNSASETVTVVAPASVVAGGTSVSFDASVRSGTFTSIDSFRTLWTFPSTGALFLDARNVTSSSGSDQSAMISGIIGARLVFPLARIELRQSSGSSLLDNAAYTNVPTDGAGSADCVARGIGTGTEFYVCSDPGGFTSFTYRRETGTVTYMSNQYQKVWNGSSFDETAFVDNGTTVTTGVVAALGSSFSFDVRITDASGTYVISREVPLAPFTQSTIDPSACSTSSFTLDTATYLANTCTFSSYVFTGVEGVASGTGTTTLRATP